MLWWEKYRLPGSTHKASKPTPPSPDFLAQKERPLGSSSTHLFSLLPIRSPPPVTWNLHAISEWAVYFHSSTLDAFLQSLECSFILSFKILIILKVQLKCLLFSKINPNSKSKRIILFLASYWHLDSVRYFILSCRQLFYYLSTHPHWPLNKASLQGTGMDSWVFKK